MFTNVLLADEINRAPPKTQAALLEAMQERQVTTDDRTRPLERPFLVLATQNPIEYEGTYPLPEAQLDRFLIRMRVGYPSPKTSGTSWSAGSSGARMRPRCAQWSTARSWLRCSDRSRTCTCPRPSAGTSWRWSEPPAKALAFRSAPVHAGTLALMKLSRVRALFDGRDFVVPDDVKAVAVPVLAHRLALRPELWVQRVQAEDVVRDCMNSVAVPTTTSTS